jgi:hypothetical protein
MSNSNSLRLPWHRLYLFEHWQPKSNPKLAKAHSIITKLLLHKLTKEDLEPGKKVPAHIEADAAEALEHLREAAVQSDVCLLGELEAAAKENKDLWENGVGQDLKRKIILAYSQFFYENNPSPRPLVWVEAPNPPQGITLAPRGFWQLAAVEPTRDQLREQLLADGLRFTKRAYNAYLKELGLDDLKSFPTGRPRK